MTDGRTDGRTDGQTGPITIYYQNVNFGKIIIRLSANNWLVGVVSHETPLWKLLSFFTCGIK
jgi:hypothetical protein